MNELSRLKCIYRKRFDLVRLVLHRWIARRFFSDITKISLILLLLLITSCRLLNRTDSESRIETGLIPGVETVLLCSSECADRGQCGTSAEQELVLMNSDEPATFGHNMALPAGTEIKIVAEESRTAIQLADSQPISLTFYLVQAAEVDSGWVAEWCIDR